MQRLFQAVVIERVEAVLGFLPIYLFILYFLFNVRSSLTNIGPPPRVQSEFRSAPSPPPPPPPHQPTPSLLSLALALSLSLSLSLSCSAAGLHLNEPNWRTVSDHHLSTGYPSWPAFHPEHMNLHRQTLLRSWTDRSEEREEEKKMAQRVVLFLLWLFDRSFAGFPNQINIGKCLFFVFCCPCEQTADRAGFVRVEIKRKVAILFFFLVHRRDPDGAPELCAVTDQTNLMFQLLHAKKTT